MCSWRQDSVRRLNLNGVRWHRTLLLLMEAMRSQWLSWCCPLVNGFNRFKLKIINCIVCVWARGSHKTVDDKLLHNNHRHRHQSWIAMVILNENLSHWIWTFQTFPFAATVVCNWRQQSYVLWKCEWRHHYLKCPRQTFFFDIFRESPLVTQKYHFPCAMHTHIQKMNKVNWLTQVAQHIISWCWRHFDHIVHESDSENSLFVWKKLNNLFWIFRFAKREKKKYVSKSFYVIKT